MADRRRKARRRPPPPLEGPAPSRVRRWTLLGIMAVACGALVARAVDQQIFETDFLQREGARRHLRVVEMPAHRGMILDRSGEPLAISTPVHSVWANPRELVPDRGTLAPLAEVLDMGVESLRGLLARRSDRAFVYLKRQVTPAVARAVTALDVPGVGLQREYRRYYPSGEVTAHLVGFTDIDDIGQEGMELAYDGWLRGEPGRKRVVRDGRARVVENIESIREPRPGRDLVLSIDRRLQFLAYRELKAAVGHNKARGGTAVILDVTTGEILAMVNQPSYNPNGSRSGLGGRVRNRALTDVFEPGSTMKPFTVSAALELGRFRSDTPVDTSPGVLRVGRNQVKDVRDYGLLDVAGVIRKSSNVGASKIALSLPPEGLWTTLQGFGFGELTAAAFPGEATGQLAPYQSWARFDQAALAFGYGISVTAVQLAQAYAVIAGDGLRRPVSLVRVDEPPAG
ncbi:MAG: penicillin-binding transpeptidase domain-containing protein, partial [Chromatiales bacterium]